MDNTIIKEERDNSMYDQVWEFQGELVAPESGPLAYFVVFLTMCHELRELVQLTTASKKISFTICGIMLEVTSHFLFFLFEIK
jgi:hypothetical protein